MHDPRRRTRATKTPVRPPPEHYPTRPPCLQSATPPHRRPRPTQYAEPSPTSKPPAAKARPPESAWPQGRARRSARRPAPHLARGRRRLRTRLYNRPNWAAPIGARVLNMQGTAGADAHGRHEAPARRGPLPAAGTRHTPPGRPHAGRTAKSGTRCAPPEWPAHCETATRPGPGGIARLMPPPGDATSPCGAETRQLNPFGIWRARSRLRRIRHAGGGNRDPLAAGNGLRRGGYLSVESMPPTPAGLRRQFPPLAAILAPCAGRRAAPPPSAPPCPPGTPPTGPPEAARSPRRP